MKLPPGLTIDEVMEAAESQMFGLENPGFCMACGEYHDCCDPDTANGQCDVCAKMAVFGASAILVRHC